MGITWKGFAKGLLLSAGMLGGFAAGHLFYFERYTAGVAMFLLTALFLFYAMADLTSSSIERNDGAFFESVEGLQGSLSEIALIVADNALNQAKYIGRTLPSTWAEITKLEDDLLPLLASLQISHKERDRIAQELDKLKTRSRQNEGRRVLSK